MLFKNTLSIFRESQILAPSDYCLYFSGNGFINLDALSSRLDMRANFSFELEFKVDSLPTGGEQCLMVNVLEPEVNALAIAINSSKIIASFFTAEGQKEFIATFEEIDRWNHIRVAKSEETIECTYNESPMANNPEPVLSIPFELGCRIASNTADSQYFVGSVDNILVTDLSDPIAQYLLNEGTGSIVNDSVSHYHGNIINGSWQIYG